MLFDPFFIRPNITAFVPRIEEVRERVRRLLDPVVRDDTHVCVAHGVLAEYLDAVFRSQEVISCIRESDKREVGQEENVA